MKALRSIDLFWQKIISLSHFDLKNLLISEMHQANVRDVTNYYYLNYILQKTLVEHRTKSTRRHSQYMGGVLNQIQSNSWRNCTSTTYIVEANETQWVFFTNFDVWLGGPLCDGNMMEIRKNVRCIFRVHFNIFR